MVILLKSRANKHLKYTVTFASLYLFLRVGGIGLVPNVTDCHFVAKLSSIILMDV